jgi:hypothetical protein
LTKNLFFHLTTTLLGVNVTDTFLLANHHRIINHTSGTSNEKNITIQRFASLLTFQLIQNAKHLGRPCQHFLPEEIQAPQKTVVSDLSLPSSFSNKPAVWSLTDTNGKTHYLVKFHAAKDPSGHCRTKKCKCKWYLEEKER